MKKRALLVLLTLLVITASVAAYYRSASGDKTPQFMTATVTRGDVVEVVEATGKLEAVTTVQVGSQVSGTIESLHADFNSRVRKGQVVARLDSSVMAAQVEQAEATVVRLNADVDRARIALDDAQNKLRRAKELFGAGLIPATDLETADTTARQAEASLKAAQAQVTQAQASLNQSRVNLSHTVITAPVDGIVISRNVDVGQTVAASMSAPTLFEIAKDLTAMQVNASVDESDIGQIKAGQHVTFKVDAYPNDTFTGTVSQVRLDPVVAQNVVSYVTIIDVPNRDLKLKPGMTANVTVEAARADNVVRVPNAALRFRPTQEMLPQVARTTDRPHGSGEAPVTDSPSGSGARAAWPGRPNAGGNRTADDAVARVWTLQDGQLRPVRVRTGISDGTVTAIVDGQLAENTTVITGVATSTTASSQTSTSPLMPFGGRRPGAVGGARQGSGTRSPGAGR
jgi:HlyD family secretion protein